MLSKFHIRPQLAKFAMHLLWDCWKKELGGGSVMYRTQTFDENFDERTDDPTETGLVSSDALMMANLNVSYMISSLKSSF